MVDTRLTHSQTFTNKVLPQLFHGAPAQFWQYLDRDGTKFLVFYWDTAREKLPVDLRASHFGLNYTVSEPAPRTRVALILLPEPKVPGEAYYSALIYRPDRRILLVTDMTRIFNLEYILDEAGQPATRLVQWDTHLQRIEYPDFVAPSPEPFLAAVMQHLDD
jgi:hypothetical protein